MTNIYLKLQISDELKREIAQEPLFAKLLNDLPEDGAIIPVDIEKNLAGIGVPISELIEIIKKNILDKN